MQRFVHFLQKGEENNVPPLDALEMATEQERRKLFLRYLSRGWIMFGMVTLITFPFFPTQRSVFGFLIVATFLTYLIVRWLNGAERTKLAGVVFTLLVNFSLYGLFLMLVGEMGAREAFNTQATVWMLMGLAVIFAGAFVNRWAAPGMALFNTILLIGTRLVLAPEVDPRPSAVVLWWILALTIWLYERTLEQALGRLRKARGSLEDLVQARTQTLAETVAQLKQAKNQLEAANRELETFSSSISKELDESEARFEQIFQISPAPMIITGDAGITDVNDAFLQMTGYTREELLGKSSVEANLWQNPEERERAIELLDQQGFVRDFEVRFPRKSGEEGVAIMSVTELKQPDGKLRYLSHVLDFTERKRAETALRESESRYRQAIEAAGAVPYYQDYTLGKYTFVGKGLQKITGYSEEERENHPWDTLVEETVLLGECAGLTIEEASRRVRSGEIKAWKCDYRIRTNEGESRWVTDSAVEVFSEQGTPRGSIGILQDITERKKLERELQDERDFVLQIINTMGQGLTVTDEVGHFVLINPAYVQMTGYELQDLIGESPADITAPEDREVLAQARAARKQGRVTSYENRIRRKDGSYIPVLITGAPRLKEGQYAGAIAVIADLTEIKRAEQALRKSEARYRAVVENQTEFIVRWKPDGIRTFANEAYLHYFGLTLEQALSSSFLPLVAEEDRRAIEEKIFRLVSGTVTSETDTHQVIRPDDSIAWQEWTDHAIYSENGEIVEFQSIGRDITGRKLAEEQIRELNAELEKRVIERTAQLEAANKELEAFSYSVSHDLRAPLRAINGFSLVLAEEISSSLNEAHQRYLQLIRDNVQRMNHLIEDLLALSRLGRQSLRKQTVDVAALTQDVFDELQTEFEGRDIDLSIADLPPCDADPALLHQVFTNLLSNALKYSGTRDVTKIEVGCQEQDEAWVYFVRDNGVGFDMQYADKLFGVFQRLHRQEEFEGTGVGLATVQRIIHRHGGRIWAEAEVGRGATFYFTLARSP
ncbi:MAG TPA: PAS domain S-box protein [Anaerolineales bacterium]|nr:PAS domain S-box protein [Anaerolineales bacterium]